MSELAPSDRRDRDSAELPGVWLNADPAPRALVAIETRLEGDRLAARWVGADVDGPAAWGTVVSGELYTDGPESPTLVGALLDCDLGFAGLRLQVQLKLGVAVVGTFVTLADRRQGAPGPRVGFVREFLGRLPPEIERSALPTPAGGWPPPSGSEKLAAALAPVASGAERLIAGRWTATAAEPAAVAALTVDPNGSVAAVRICEAGAAADAPPIETEATVFGCVEEDGIDSVCLLGSYDRDDGGGQRRVELQIRQNRGILAVTTFTRYSEAVPGRFDHMRRELFYRDAPAREPKAREESR